MKIRCRIRNIISLLLVVSLVVSLTACAGSPPTPTLTDPNNPVVTETIEVENVITENVLAEHITEENYLTEIIIAEDKITELLLEEDTINEVLLCKTVYVPEDHISEFAENSQTSKLFGEGIDFKSVLTKVAIGSGIILTVVVLKKANLSEPVMSVVAAAADKSLKFAENGALIGSIYGGLTGAADEVDETGRTSAVIGFATATAGLILSIVSLAVELPSGGGSTVPLATGIKLVIAGISCVGATIGTAVAGYNAVKTFTSTDAVDIDWDNINWDQVGVAAAEKAISNGADGYMWGAIVGTVYGGADGYEYYHKYNTPYTSYKDRIAHLKQMVNNGTGKWTGVEGESDFILNEPIRLSDDLVVTKVTYRNGVPDFSPYAIAEVKISNMTKERKGADGNYAKADEVLAQYWQKIKYNNKSEWKASDVKNYRENNKLTWHEMSNMESMQLVPYEVNDTFKHYGGVAECKAMLRLEGGEDFD